MKCARFKNPLPCVPPPDIFTFLVGGGRTELKSEVLCSVTIKRKQVDSQHSKLLLRWATFGSFVISRVS